MSYRRKVKRRVSKGKVILKFFSLLIIILIISYFIINNNNKIDIYRQKINQMQQYGKELSIAEDNEVKTYYVSATGTSTDGTDINNPMSLAQANKKTYYGNEKVLFKCGDIFYGTIIFNVKASEDEMFYIGSYGEGEKPIVSGANILVNKNAWEQDENGIYRIDLSNYSNFEGIGKTYWEPYNIGFIADEQGNIYGNRKNSKDALESENDFFCENNYLYLKSDKNPSEKLGKIKFVSRNDLVKISSYTIMDDLNIQYTGAHGIAKKDDKIENVYIHNCIVQNIGGSVQNANTFTRYGNGIEFWNQGKNILVENCIMRNTYDAGFTFQGSAVTTGFENIVARNNIFINCTYPIEVFCRNDTSGDDAIKVGISAGCIENNISINQGRGWGYTVRPDKDPSSEIVVWDLPENKTDLEVKNNKYYNSLRLKYIWIYNNCKNVYKEAVYSHDNEIYLNKDTYLINNTGNYQDKSVLQEYNQEKNSEFELLTDDLITKISNAAILNSNDYNQIKTYYENIEKEIKFSELAEETIAKYTDFQQKFKTELSAMSDISTTITNLKNNVKTLTSANIWDNLESLYKTGDIIIDRYKNKTLNISKQKIEEILTEINKIGESYVNLIDNMQITQNPQITDLQTLLQSVDKLDISITENSDLDIVDEKVWRDSIKDSLEILKATGTTEEHKSYNYIKAKNMLAWTSNMLNIYIDEYIQTNPVNVTYSTTDLTNKDVAATLNIGSDSQITNNNNQKTYIFKENGEFIFEYKRRGKTFQAKATVSNIDKKVPEIIGVVDGQVYNQPVRIEVKDSNIEKLEIYLNGSLQSNSELIQAISKEGFYKVNATDKAGNSISVSFDIIYKGENDYDVTKDKICNITVNTTVEEIAQKLPFGENYTIYRDGRGIQENEKVATGDILKLQSGREYTLIVKGDLNSDGMVNIVDLVRTQNAILKRRQLTEIEQLAADANYDKEQITIKDLVRIQIIILNPTKM